MGITEERTGPAADYMKYFSKSGRTNAKDAKDFLEHMAITSLSHAYMPSVHVGMRLNFSCVAEIGHSKTLRLKLSDVAHY